MLMRAVAGCHTQMVPVPGESGKPGWFRASHRRIRS
jgi:hypothetical protein